MHLQAQQCLQEEGCVVDITALALARAAAATAFLLPVRSVSTAKFGFNSKIQFRQLSSVSTVKFSFDS